MEVTAEVCEAMTEESTTGQGFKRSRTRVGEELFFGPFDDFYAETHSVVFPDGTRSGTDVDLLLQRAERLRGPVLEAGCGVGRRLIEMARAGYAVTGIERSPGRLDVFRRRLSSEPPGVAARVLIEQGDMFEVPISGTYALCYTDGWYLTDDIAKIVDLIRSMASQLMSGGRIILSGYEWMRRVKDASVMPVRHRERTGPNGTRHVHRKTFRFDQRKNRMRTAVTVERHPTSDAQMQTRSYSWPVTYVDDGVFGEILEAAGCRMVRSYQTGEQDGQWLELRPVG